MLMRFPILLSWLLNLILLVGPMDSPAALAQQPPVNLYVSPNGQDTNLGTQDQPVQTITRALRMAQAGDTVYIRGGTYDTIFGGYIFRNSGMEQAPITVTNFPGEQVVLRITNRDERYPAFRCWSTSDWRTPKADYIRVVGTPVESVTLPSGIQSNKGIVVAGPHDDYTLAAGFFITDCDYWEVSGVDFVDVASGIFALKRNNQTMDVHSPTNWWVHDNRVFGFYAESGMQFNGDFNVVENNEIYKVKNKTYTQWGCQHINIVGNDNVVRNNTIDEWGSAEECRGILMEWDLADNNTIEGNRISDVDTGIQIAGGDGNIIRDNMMIASQQPNAFTAGITILSYLGNQNGWGCNDESRSILPANNPEHPDYYRYYEPRDCQSRNNSLVGNQISGFAEAVRLFPNAGEETLVHGNVFSRWQRGTVCLYDRATGECMALPEQVTMLDNHDDRGSTAVAVAPPQPPSGPGPGSGLGMIQPAEDQPSRTDPRLFLLVVATPVAVLAVLWLVLLRARLRRRKAQPSPPRSTRQE